MPGTAAPLGYKLYRLDAGGRIAGPPLEFLLLTDDEAIDAVKLAAVVGPHELWTGARLVQRFNFADAAADET